MPERIQLRRTKGWRKPAGAVVVARPSRWGNPFRVGVDGDRAPAWPPTGAPSRPATAVHGRRRAPELAGHDLACWCPLDEPCHADVLLAVAAVQT